MIRAKKVYINKEALRLVSLSSLDTDYQRSYVPFGACGHKQNNKTIETYKIVLLEML